MRDVCSRASHFSEFEKSEGEDGECAVRQKDMPERGGFAGLCNCAGLIGAERKTFFFYLVPWRRGEKGYGRGWKEREGKIKKENEEKTADGVRIPYKVCTGARR